MVFSDEKNTYGRVLPVFDPWVIYADPLFKILFFRQNEHFERGFLHFYGLSRPRKRFLNVFESKYYQKKLTSEIPWRSLAKIVIFSQISNFYEQ